MGYRTLVMLYNDESSVWSKDLALGTKIQNAANWTHVGNPEFTGGRVVECKHADEQTLAIVDSYTFESVAHSRWHNRQDIDARNLALLQEFANKMGYYIRKKDVK